MEQIIESQKQLNNLSRQLAMARSQMQSKEYERKVNMLTLRELSQVPENTKVYKASGKMFVLSDISTISTELTTGISKAKSEVTQLESLQSNLSSKIKENETLLREVVSKLNLGQQ